MYGIKLKELLIKNNLLDEFFDNIIKKDIIYFSGGFFCYDEFKVISEFKKIIEKILLKDIIFDYSNKELDFITKNIIKDYYNYLYKWNISNDNIFLTSGTFSGFQILNKFFRIRFGNKIKKILLIVPNYFRGVEILFENEDIIYFIDYNFLINNLNIIQDDFYDICFLENPIWPQGKFLDKSFLDILSKKVTYIVIDGSINSYNYYDEKYIYLPDNAFFVTSISKEFQITFKGIIVTKNKDFLGDLSYVHNLFGYGTLLLSPVLLLSYSSKLYSLSKENYNIFYNNNKNILEIFGIEKFFSMETQKSIKLSIINNLLIFRKRKKYLYFILKKHILNKKIKIYDNEAGINIMIGIKKKYSYKETIEKMIFFKFDLLPLYFYFQDENNYEYHLFKLSISGQTEKGYLIGLKRFSYFLDNI